MKSEILEKNRELLLLIFNLSGIKNIKLENIESIELGGRSFCFICKDTEFGDLFVKIDMDLEAFSFVSAFREMDKIRKDKTILLLSSFSESYGSIPKLFSQFAIPEFIDEIKIPSFLVGKQISFCQMIKGKCFETFLQNPAAYQRFYMKNYDKHNIELMFEEVGRFHNFFGKKEIQSIPPFFQLIIEDYKTLITTLLKNKIIVNGEIVDSKNYLLQLKENIELIYNLFYGDKKSVDEIIMNNLLIVIKENYFKYLQKFELRKPELFFSQLDLFLYNNSNNIPESDLFTGKKIILLESYINAYLNIEKINSILKYLILIKDRIPNILQLPEVLTHNDIHPLNFIITDRQKVFLVDTERAGKNKRICDLGLTLTTNAIDDESILCAILSGYRKHSKITHNELRLIYDFYILSNITSFIRQIDEMKFENFRVIKHLFNPSTTLDKIEKLHEMSKNNTLPELLDYVIEQNLDSLDLAGNNITRNTFQKRLLKIRAEGKAKLKEI